MCQNMSPTLLTALHDHPLTKKMQYYYGFSFLILSVNGESYGNYVTCVAVVLFLIHCDFIEIVQMYSGKIMVHALT